MKTVQTLNTRIMRTAAVLICFVLALLCMLPASAPAQETEGGFEAETKGSLEAETENGFATETETEASAGKTVRVGWYESAFHHTDEFGRRSGYGYEYQQRIAAFTGWNYEYVEGSWSELLEMLIDGEIDLLSDVSYTEERAQKILYSALGMGSEDYHVFIRPDYDGIRPDDFSSFDGKKVGVNKNSIQAQLFAEWAQSHDAHPRIVELTVKTPEMLEMLAQGEIDALVTLDIYGKTADVLPVCKVGSADSYFGINKRRPDIKRELDVAMNRIMEDDRYFNQQLAEKYESSQAVLGFLTPDELEWYENHGTIRVGYRDHYLPFCEYDGKTQSLTGALSDFLGFARTCEKNAELDFASQAFGSTEDALKALTDKEIDCAFPAGLSAYDGEQRGILITDPIIKTEIYAAVRTADHEGVSPDREMTVALVKENPNFVTFLSDHFPNWKIAYYDSSDEAFAAVASGEADCILVSSYRLNRKKDMCEKYHLSTLTTGQTMDLSFAVRKEDDCLYSILNKICRLIPDTLVNTSLTNYAIADEKVTFGQFLKDNLLMVAAVIAAIATVITALLLWSIRAENKARGERQLISAVELDPLTKLYNRNFFFEYANRIHQKKPEPKMDAVVMDLEQFHSVNELGGRQFGDQVLQTLGDEIREFLKETEGIGGRFEGDHFDVFCEPQEDYQALLDRFQNRLSRLSGNARIRLRMGVMPWKESMEPVRMFDRARTACSSVRGSGKHLMIYDEEMQRREQLDQRLRHDLGRAIEERQFQVYYQPKYEIQCDPPRLSSAEALIRWQHPQLGLIAPDDFIPMFEKNGQISEIDHYVWREAARQIAEWRDRYGVTVVVSVNLSRVDALDPALEQILDGLLEEYHLDHSLLNLEVTESAYTENAGRLSEIIQRLRGKGYVIEMDDFGTGYSSLNMLTSMPIDVLKMDRGFIMNIEHSEKDVRLVELILEIARNLQVPVVAEGVETRAQFRLLKDLGCELVQGFYFSRPLPAEVFESKYLAEETKRD